MNETTIGQRYADLYAALATVSRAHGALAECYAPGSAGHMEHATDANLDGATVAYWQRRQTGMRDGLTDAALEPAT